MRTRSLFAFLSIWILIAATIGLSSCAALKQANIYPKASVQGVSVGDIGLTGLTLAFDINVTNPYTVTLPVLGLDFHLESGGTEFLSGQVAGENDIAAGATETIGVPIRVPYLELYDVISRLEGGSRVPYHAHFDLHLDAPVVGRVSLPIEASGDLPVPKL